MNAVDTEICPGHGPMERTEFAGVVVRVACSTCGKQPIDLLETYQWGGTFPVVDGQSLMYETGHIPIVTQVATFDFQFNKLHWWWDAQQFPTAWQLWREGAPRCPRCTHRSRMRMRFNTLTWSCRWGHVVTDEEMLALGL